ncbi:MAG TPA: outer membrane protein assembly factor BamD, partial [Longimicrobiaceae bacterium]|nr:outer membrane protein assembly factor BamD [Longimicrobiaceae bacterium]
MTRTRSARGGTLALLALLFLSSCALFKASPPLSSEQAFERGMAAYADGKFGRAATLLTRWVEANAAGDPRMPAVLLALGRSHLETREFVTAGSEFLRVLTDYPTSPEQTTARYGLCQAYHGLSPKAPLDQQYTHVAITYCESYAGYYPEAPQADTARQWVVAMREKLAEKSYLNGMFYFRRGAYDAAVIYFVQTAASYPETRWAPAALLKVVEAYERVGYEEEAEEARARLRREFPQ